MIDFIYLQYIPKTHTLPNNIKKRLNINTFLFNSKKMSNFALEIVSLNIKTILTIILQT